MARCTATSALIGEVVLGPEEAAALRLYASLNVSKPLRLLPFCVYWPAVADRRLGTL